MDVDTISCATVGLQSIRQIANQRHFKFTTFFHVGRPIVRLNSIKNRLSGSCHYGETKTLPPLKKQSLRSIVETIVINPNLRNYSSVLTDLVADGHEVGLHGGRNHGRWADEVVDWNLAKITQEISWAMCQFEPAIREQLSGFSSPEWRSSDKVEAAVTTLGFSYLADLHGPGSVTRQSTTGLSVVNTSGCGEPGGIGFIEYLDANFTSRSRRRDEVHRTLEAGLPCIFYDHPGYAGIRGRDTFELLVDTLKAEGIEIRLVKEIARD